MNSQAPVAGTYRLDGMLQGTLLGDLSPDQIHHWVASAAKQGLKFHPQIEGRSFSLVADSASCRTAALGQPGLTPLLKDALQSLLELLPEPARQTAFSTIRSEEFRPGKVTQTLYTVGTNGRIISEQRSLDIDTELPPPELSPASIRKFAIFATLTILLCLFISSFFIDYRALLSDARDVMAPLHKEEITVEQDALRDAFSLKVAEVRNSRGIIIFDLTRGPGWNDTLQSSPKDPDATWPDFLIRQAIHQKRIRIELYNKKGDLISKGDITLEGLHRNPKSQVAYAVELKGRLARIVVRP